MKIGKRKALAAVAAVVVAGAAVTGWVLWGTDGLLVVTLGTTLAAALGLGLLIVQSQRQIARLMSSTQRSIEATVSGSQAEQLLRTVQAGFIRSDQILETLLTEWRHIREEMLTAFTATIEREIGVTGREIGVASREVAIAASRIESSLQELSLLADVTERALEEMPSTVKTELWNQNSVFYRQLEALASLYFDIQPPTSLPPTRFWAASPDLLRFLYQIVRERKPDLVVECGSGASTIVMAHAMKKNGTGKLVSLEHLESFKSLTEDLADQQGLTDFIEVLHAPLRPMTIDDVEWMWYSTEGIPTGEIDILFVDGPPSSVGPKSRYPAVAALGDRLSSNGLVILDDYHRSDEAEIAERWMSERENWTFSVLGHEKGTALFGTDPPRENAPHVTLRAVDPEPRQATPAPSDSAQ